MQLFIANIDSISKNPDDYLALLTPDNQARAAQFHRTIRKLQFILAHLIADNIGTAHTSIAHKDNWVVVAASDALVGVDIENTSVRRDFVSAAALMGIKQPTTLFDFYKDFTAAEAVYKLAAKPICTRFVTHGKYLICVTSTRPFTVRHLSKFNPDSVLPTKQK